MIKKIALAGALAATASFATWDKFPVLENHKGQAKVGVTYDMQGDYSDLGIYAGARYTVIQGLELGLKIPFRFYSDFDGNDLKQDGLGNIPLMVRYQFMPVMNAFVDVNLPVGDDSYNEEGAWGFHAGVQYSQGFGMVTLGTEAGLTITTEGDDEVSPPWNLNVGAEADFTIGGPVTPYVGADLNVLLGEYTHDGDEIPGSDESGTLGLWIYVGAGYAINEQIGLDLSFGFGLGEDYYGKDTPMSIDFNASFKF
ncbi:MULTISPECIES: outer membrane beta-barrel protein [unclassified Fibrobacter]|uniref:outer membrane beta-barrel protein n=1 Tax=unclassified Fibrobacter TaxID=2634177 RepID=UPI000D6AD560|nr:MULTISPECIES: outer membrane beta-barrel protein [unclassified Fibrobacter]PWJ64076.1 outer membrane protein with beta-barrel domain [Fibrobacter sp. UWR4]PZW69187.1 outer membrane protein with beta-barrel domain [Fibrobacter sp. UWR1]